MSEGKIIRNFKDIPKFTQQPCYRINLSWGYLEDWLEREFKDGLELNRVTKMLEGNNE